MLKLGELVAVLKTDDGKFKRGLDEAKKEFSGFGDKLKQGAAIAGALAGAALAAGVASYLQLDGAKAKFAAQLGGDAQYAGDMGAIAGRVWTRGFGESAESAMAAVRATLSSGLLTEDAGDADIQRISVKAQALSTVFDQDVTQAARAAGQMIRNGLAADADEAFDILTRGFQQSGDLAGDLLDTVSEYSTKFRDLGLSGQQATGILTQGLKAGARDIDTVADSLKEFAIRSIDGSKTTAEGFKAIGLNADDMARKIASGGPQAAAALDLTLDRLRAMKNPTEQQAAAVALFGTKAEDLGQALFALDPSNAVDALGDVTGAADKMTQTLEQSASQRLESFKRRAQEALVEKLGEAVPHIEATFGWLQRNSDWVVPLATGLGILAGAITLIVVAMKVWAVVQTVLNLALWTSPITWIIVGIVALVAVIVLIATKTTWFQDLWRVVWGGIKDAASAVWGWISGTLWPGMVAVWDGIAAGALWLWHNAIEPAWNGIVAAVEFAWRIISSTLALMNWGINVLIAQPMLWLWHNVFEPTGQGIAAVVMWLWATVLSPTFDAIGAGARMVGAAAMWLWTNAITPAFEGVGAAARWLWNNAVSPTWSAITSGTERVGEAVRTVFTKVGGWISSAFSGAAGIVKGAMNGVIGAVNGAISGINSVIGKANSLPGVNFPTIPSIPYLAKGGRVLRGGRAVVGERGAEVVDLPAGAAVYPHGTVPAGDGGITVEHLEVKAFSDRFSLDQVMDDLAMHGVH